MGLWHLDGADHCGGQTYQGRRQAHGIVVKLYNNDRLNQAQLIEFVSAHC
jgi:hypothetical protein